MAAHYAPHLPHGRPRHPFGIARKPLSEWVSFAVCGRFNYLAPPRTRVERDGGEPWRGVAQKACWPWPEVVSVHPRLELFDEVQPKARRLVAAMYGQLGTRGRPTAKQVECASLLGARSAGADAARECILLRRGSPWVKVDCPLAQRDSRARRPQTPRARAVHDPVPRGATYVKPPTG
jgi:hypothetical protein